MESNHPQPNTEGPKVDPATFVRRVFQPSSSERVGIFFVLVNLAMYFVRPQELPGMSFLGSARLPVILSMFPLAAWLGRTSRTWVPQARIMMLFLAVETLRMVLGKFVIDDLVRNDFWQRNVLKDLFLQICTLIFPLIAFFCSGIALRKFLNVWILLGAYLGLYAATHAGTGPGGFLGDENDMGLALLVFLPFPLAFATEFRGPGAKRLRWLIAATMILFGVVATVSRGAFVGLVCVLAYFFWRSRQKGMLVVATVLMALVVVPFLPKDYIREMKSIQDTSGGTAEIRRHYWTLATRVFLDPHHVLAGVGLNNVSFHMGDYETGADLQKFPSSAGRAVHSLYFQLLPDLGLWGVAVIGTLVLGSIRTNSRCLKMIDRSLRDIRIREAGQPSEPSSMNGLVSTELSFLRPFIAALNVSFVALLSAGAFISVLYYPMLWLLAGLSGLAARYLGLVLANLESIQPPPHSRSAS